MVGPASRLRLIDCVVLLPALAGQRALDGIELDWVDTPGAHVIDQIFDASGKRGISEVGTQISVFDVQLMDPLGHAARILWRWNARGRTARRWRSWRCGKNVHGSTKTTSCGAYGRTASQ